MSISKIRYCDSRISRLFVYYLFQHFQFRANKKYENSIVFPLYTDSSNLSTCVETNIICTEACTICLALTVTKHTVVIDRKSGPGS